MFLTIDPRRELLVL